MASVVNAQEATCIVCEENFSENIQNLRPLILGCGHSFCRGCCKQMIKKKGVSIACPLCNAITVCDDVKKLAQNWSLISVLQAPPPPPPTPALNCQNPDTECETIANHYCSTCALAFCEECAVSTHKLKLFQSHKMCPIDDRKPKCKLHPDYFSDMYCETDKTLICMKCHLVGKHKDHSVLDAQDVSRSIRDQLSKKLIEGKAVDNRLQEKLDHLAGDVKDLEESARNSLRAVATMSEALIEQVNRRRLELEAAIHETKQKKIMKCDKMQCDVVESKSVLSLACQSIETVLKEYDYDVLEKADSICNELDKASSKSLVALKAPRFEASVQFVSSEQPVLQSIASLGAVDKPKQPSKLRYDDTLIRSGTATFTWEAVEFGACDIKYQLLFGFPNFVFVKDGISKQTIVHNVEVSSTSYKFDCSNVKCDVSYEVMVRAIAEIGKEEVKGSWSEPIWFSPPPMVSIRNGASLILTESESHVPYFESLFKMFQRNVRLTLLYRGSRDGFTAANFNSKCGNTKQTLTVIRTTSGHISGGFRPGKLKNSNMQPVWRIQQAAAHGGQIKEVDKHKQWLFSLHPHPLKLSYQGDVPHQQPGGQCYGCFVCPRGQYDILIQNKQVSCQGFSHPNHCPQVADGFELPPGGLSQNTLFGVNNVNNVNYDYHNDRFGHQNQGNIEEIEVFEVEFPASSLLNTTK